MIMETSVHAISAEIWHKSYNLESRDNLDELPAEKAVFGVFAIVDDKPVNCRYVGTAQDLREAVRKLFEEPPGAGLRLFMQGPWIQMLVYDTMPGVQESQLQAAMAEWTTKYLPAIGEDGEYPGYYDQKKSPVQHQ